MRKIDALVAEKVFDSKVTWREEPRFDGTIVTTVREVYAPYPSNPALGTKAVPHYSTDIAAAWEVVEKLHASGFHCDVFGLVERDPTDQRKVWNCSFSKRRDCADIVSGTGNTVPLAICLAALRAVGVSEQEIKEAMG